MRHDRHKQHVKVLQRHFRAILIIQVEESAEVELAAARPILKQNDEEETDKVAHHDNPVNNLHGHVLDIVELCGAKLTFAILALHRVVEDGDQVLNDAEGYVDADQAHALLPQESIIISVTDPPDKDHHKKEDQEVDQVEAGAISQEESEE